MPAYEETLDDFNLKWADTYAYYKGEVVQVNAGFYEEDSENPKIRIDLHNNKKRYIESDLHCLTPILFDSQFFNCTDFTTPLNVIPSGCLHIARQPQRQNKRSICLDNTTIVSLFEPILQQYKKTKPRLIYINEIYIKQIVDKVFPPYLDALKLCDEYLMVAISPQFAVALSNISSNKYLFASSFGFIGEADRENIYVHHYGSYQEVCDFVRRSNLNLRVIDART